MAKVIAEVREEKKERKLTGKAKMKNKRKKKKTTKRKYEGEKKKDFLFLNIFILFIIYMITAHTNIEL